MSITTQLYSFDKEKADNKIDEVFDRVSEEITLEKRNENELDEAEYDYMRDYLDYGKYESVYINSPLGDDQCMLEIEYLMLNFNLELNGGEWIPTKEGLIDLYSSINAKALQKVIDAYAEKEGLSPEDARYNIVEHTIKRLHPLTKSLKNYENSILIISHDYDFPEVIPSYVSTSFMKKFQDMKKICE